MKSSSLGSLASSGIRRVALSALVAILMLMTSISVQAAAPTVQFSSPQNLSNSNAPASMDDPHAIATSGSHVYVTWRGKMNGAQGTLFAASADNGTTWGPTMDLSNGTGTASLQKISADGSNVYAVWIGKSLGVNLVYLRASHDYGVTFGPTVKISDFLSIEPKMASCDGGVYVSWVNSTVRAQGMPGPQTMFFRASQDNGTTWGPIINLQANDPNPTAKGNEEEVECSGPNVYVIYSDYTLGPRNVFVRVSHDRGVTFSPFVDISKVGASGNIREPVISVSGNYAYVYYIYRTSSKSNYQAFVSASNDSGTTWGAPMNVCNDMYNCHEPFMASSGPNAYVVLHEFTATAQTALYFIVSHDGGKTWSAKLNLIPGETSKSSFGAITASGSWVFITWSDKQTSNNWQEKFVASNDNGTTFGPTHDLSNDTGNAGLITYDHQDRAISSSSNFVYVLWLDTTTASGNPNLFFIAGQFA